MENTNVTINKVRNQEQSLGVAAVRDRAVQTLRTQPSSEIHSSDLRGHVGESFEQSVDLFGWQTPPLQAGLVLHGSLSETDTLVPVQGSAEPFRAGLL